MHPSSTLAVEFTATSTYTHGQYLLVLYGFVVAAFALFAAGLYGAKTTSEVSKAYRPAALASTMICWVASKQFSVPRTAQQSLRVSPITCRNERKESVSCPFIVVKSAGNCR